MNHLAHALLAGDDPGLQLGGMLGDFVRGAPDPALPDGVIAGIRLHRAIDVYTDAHPEVLAAKARLHPPFRRYGGILLDMWFDHCLARDFSRWSVTPLAPFSDRLRALLQRQEALLPPALARFLHYMQANDLPAGYAREDILARSLRGIGQRLTRANPLDRAMPVLKALEQPLQAHFEAFFPQLQVFSRRWIEQDGTAAASGYAGTVPPMQD